MNEEYAVGSLSQILNKGDLPNQNKKLVSLFSKAPKAEKLFTPVNPYEEATIEEEEGNQDEDNFQNPNNRKRSNDGDESSFSKIRTRKRMKQSRNDPEKNDCTIFVGNLPNTFTEKGLKKLFRSFGEIESTRFRSATGCTPKLKEKLNKRIAIITKQFHDGRHNFNAYVKFKDEDSANKALIMNGTEIQGFHIRVDLAQNSSEHDSKKSVFLGNLPFDVEEDSIHSHFQDCGDIEGIRIVRDSETGLGKGFGYVLFRTEDSAQLALRLNNKPFQGRSLRVQRCVKKQKRNQNAVGQFNSHKQHSKNNFKESKNRPRNVFQGQTADHRSKRSREWFKNSKKGFKNPKNSFQGQNAKPFKKSKLKKFQKRNNRANRT